VLGASSAPDLARRAGFPEIAERRAERAAGGEYRARIIATAVTIAAQDREQSFFDGIDYVAGGIASLAKGGDTAFLSAGCATSTRGWRRRSRSSAGASGGVRSRVGAGMKGTMALIDAVPEERPPGGGKYDIAHELGIKRAQFNNALAEASAHVERDGCALEDAGGAAAALRVRRRGDPCGWRFRGRRSACA